MMDRVHKLAVSAGIGLALTMGWGAATYAAPAGAWIKVEFHFKAAGKPSVVYLDIPIPQADQAKEYCARDLFWAQDGMVSLARENYPEVEKAKFVSMKCATDKGAIVTASTPTNRIKMQKPMADLAAVKLFFADAKGKEVSKVYQERRAKISSEDCKQQLRALTARYKQMASQDTRLGKMTFLRGECVVLKTFSQAN